MIAGTGGGDHAADILAIFDDGITVVQLLQRHFMPDRDVMPGRKRHRGVIFGNDAEHFGAGCQAFDDNDTDIVFFGVNQKVRIGHGWHSSSRW
jgi:hypothetical protein